MQNGPSQIRRSVVDVHRRTLKKKMETLRRGVSDRHDGYAGHTVVGTTVCHMCPLKNTWEKNERPFEIGSLTRMTVVQDRPLRVRRSVTCVRWERGARAFAKDATTVRHRCLVLNDSDKTKGTRSIPNEPTSTL